MKQIFKTFVLVVLTWEAKLVLKKYKPKIVAITGSVGKTSAKDAVYAVLSQFYFTRKTDKSYNSELGIPLTILGCPNGWNDPFLWMKNMIEGLALILLPNHFPEWLVLEVGTDRPGDIEAVAQWIRPDATIVTKLSKVPVHVEFFPSVADVFKEKAHLVTALKREGVLILNADDEDVLAFRTLVDNRVVLYGTQENADVRGLDFRVMYREHDGKKVPMGIAFDVMTEDAKAEVRIDAVLGTQQMMPALAALALSRALGLSFDGSIRALQGHVPPAGRMRIVKGNKDTTIIDDTYNSSPIALQSALETLRDIETGARKIAVLGDMLEIGIFSTDEHKKAGAQAAHIADVLYTVGIRARMIAEGALDAGMAEEYIFQYEDSAEAGRDMELMMKEGDVVLVKGSQGVRMEKVVEDIMAEPDRAGELLVRQNEEWKAR